MALAEGRSTWRDAWSLSDYIVYLRSRNEMESLEYKSFSRLLGEEKLNKIWESHEEKNKRKFREPGEDED